jgi:hypothetical protein
LFQAGNVLLQSFELLAFLELWKKITCACLVDQERHTISI